VKFQQLFYSSFTILFHLLYTMIISEVNLSRLPSKRSQAMRIFIFSTLILTVALVLNACAAETPPANTPIPTDTVPDPQTVQIFLIALQDNGQSGQKIGCDDSLIPVQVAISPTQDLLPAALEELLCLNEAYFGQSGLYNALYQSDLKLDSVSIEQGEAIIHLSGTLVLGGVCDNPRVEAQLQMTALQFATVSQVSVYVNGKTLEEALSLKDE
jgi:hypothetical protein